MPDYLVTVVGYLIKVDRLDCSVTLKSKGQSHFVKGKEKTLKEVVVHPKMNVKIQLLSN